MSYMVSMVTGFLEKYDVMILSRFIYVCGKFHTNGKAKCIWKRICKTSLGKMKTISSHLTYM